MRDRALPGTLYVIAAIAAIGLPPLAGFIGKFSLLQSVPEAWTGWVWSAILVSSFFVLVAMVRAGNKLFWLQPSTPDPQDSVPLTRPIGRRNETAAIVLLLGFVVALTVLAGPALRYTMAAGEQLMTPTDYIQSVLGETPIKRRP